MVARVGGLCLNCLMFLSQLTPPQQDAFLQLATQLVAVDGQISPEEQTMLARLAMNATDWVPLDALPTSGLVITFDDHRSRAAALMELIGLAYADTVYGPEEQDFIGNIAHQMGISAVRLAQMESWVVRQLALTQEGLTLLEGV